MTTHDVRSVQHSHFDAPVLPEDKARGGELWAQVKDTERAQEYRDISARHPEKNANRAYYLAFLDEIEGMFAVPQAQPAREPWDEELLPAPVSPPAPAPAVPAFDPVSRGPAPVAPEEVAGPAASRPDPAVDDETTPGEPPEDGVEGEPPATEQVTGATVTEQPKAVAAPVPPTSSGLLAQLAGMLADGGQLTFQIMRVGPNLTVGIFPQPHAGETTAQPLSVTQTADWLDANLVPAMQGYAQARRDAFTVCQEAAQKQQAANKKTGEKPPASSASTAKSSKAKTYKVKLDAAEGTTLAGVQDGKPVPLVIGTNEVGQGNLMITATHPLFGEVKKTLAVWGDKTHDLRDQQGARVTVQATPDSAALTASRGETRIPFHGETLLPGGKWVITAEAAEHEPASQTVTLKAGKAEAVKFDLKPGGSLF